MTDLIKALHDPSSVYKEPNDVLRDNTVTHEDKIRILRQWEYDARESQVAEEENMSPTSLGSEKGSMLNRVRNALHELGIFSEEGEGAATKHG